LPFEIVTGISDPGGGIADGGYRSKRVACSIIKVGLLTVPYFMARFFTVNSMKRPRQETRSLRVDVVVSLTLLRETS